MTDTNNTKPSPLEVWLTNRNIEVTCMVVHEDETTTQLEVDSLSMRGAQREITGYFIGEGYAPVGRWEVAANEDTPEELWGRETVRRFKLKEQVAAK
jgi:hypothetical protein